MGTPIAGKNQVASPTGAEKIPVSPDGWMTSQQVADLGTGGGLTYVDGDDADVTAAQIGTGTTLVVYAILTDHWTVTLPPASGGNRVVWVVDVVGRPITDVSKSITLIPDGADTLPFTDVRGAVMLVSNGVDGWTNLSPKFPMVYDDGTVTHSISVEDVGSHEIRFQSKVNGSANGVSEAYVDIDAVDADQTNVQIGVADSNGDGPTFQLSSAAGGRVYLLNLPTADPHVNNVLWDDGGVLTRSSG